MTATWRASLLSVSPRASCTSHLMYALPTCLLSFLPHSAPTLLSCMLDRVLRTLHVLVLDRYPDAMLVCVACPCFI